MPSVTFFAVFCTVYWWKYLKNTAGLRKILFFPLSLLLHMCIAQQVKILFFHPKYFFSALKILQTFLQGWHPCVFCIKSYADIHVCTHVHSGFSNSCHGKILDGNTMCEDFQRWQHQAQIVTTVFVGDKAAPPILGGKKGGENCKKKKKKKWGKN